MAVMCVACTLYLVRAPEGVVHGLRPSGDGVWGLGDFCLPSPCMCVCVCVFVCIASLLSLLLQHGLDAPKKPKPSRHLNVQIFHGWVLDHCNGFFLPVHKMQ